MAAADQTKSIRVHILGREYALRVREEDEAFTRKVASFVNTRMEAFRDAHPEQAELTTAVITALALAEELHELRDDVEGERSLVNDELDQLTGRLASVLEADSSEES